MREPTYVQALSHAWELIWQNKILWIFGLLSLLLGQFGLNNFLGRLVVTGGENSWLFGLGGTGLNWSLFKGMPWVFVIWLAIILLALLALILVPVVVAEGALIVVAAEWYKKGKVGNLKKAWDRGVKHFWRLLSLELIKKFLLFGLVFLTNWMIAIFSGNDGRGGEFLTIITLAVSLFLAMIIVTVAIYAAGYIIVEEESFGKAIKLGAELLSQHLLVSLELNIVWTAISVLLLTGFLLLSGWVVLPLAIFGAAAQVTGSMVLINVGLVLTVIIGVLLVALIGAIFNAFTISAWMYLFMKMHHEGMVGRLVHFWRTLFNR